MKIGVDGRNLVHNLSGIGRYVWEMSRTLSERGHSVTIYMPSPPNHSIPEAQGIQVRISQARGAFRRTLWSATRLAKMANLDKVDLFWGPAHRLPRGLHQDTACVVTVHDMVWRRASQTMRWQTWLGELLFMNNAVKIADSIIAVSDATLKDVIYYYPEVSEKLRVVHPGITDFGAVGDMDTGRLKVDRPFALFVGTLEPRKNLSRLLEAYSLLGNDLRKNILLVLAGGRGWGIGELSDMVQKYHVQDTVRITGYITDRELSKLYCEAQFLIMPSLYEGFGLPIIEAQQYGTPVIASNISSMPEVTGDGGLLVNPLDTPEIAFAMYRLATDSSLHAELSRKAKRNSLRFSWESAAEKLENIFEECLVKKRKGRN